jgi:hypothetical protein
MVAFTTAIWNTGLCAMLVVCPPAIEKGDFSHAGADATRRATPAQRYAPLASASYLDHCRNRPAWRSANGRASDPRPDARRVLRCEHKLAVYGGEPVRRSQPRKHDGAPTSAAFKASIRSPAFDRSLTRTAEKIHFQLERMLYFLVELVVGGF